MSTTPRQVILYGDSLLLQGVRAALADRPDVELHWLDPALEWPLETIQACCPAVFIFDMAAVRPDFPTHAAATAGAAAGGHRAGNAPGRGVVRAARDGRRGRGSVQHRS